jgi:CBS-domain-containing membrane protein
MSVKTAIARVVRVAEIMCERVITVPAEATVFDAATTLSTHRVGGAPVLRGSRVVGVVSKSDLVDTRKELEVRVDRVMTPVVYAVRATDPAFLAVQLMVDEAIHRVIVVDDLGALAGIVTPFDVLRALRHGKIIAPHNEHVTLEYVDLREMATARRT